MRLVVTPDGRARFGPWEMRCALGRGGVARDKREGDGATPAGIVHPVAALYRSGRVVPPATALPLTPIRPGDGWCDAPDDPAYNAPVRQPYRASAEHLWRADHLYDLVVVTDHNRDPAVPGAGSAVFLHLARAGYAPTEGCIAFALADFRRLVSRLTPRTAIEVLPD